MMFAFVFYVILAFLVDASVSNFWGNSWGITVTNIVRSEHKYFLSCAMEYENVELCRSPNVWTFTRYFFLYEETDDNRLNVTIKLSRRRPKDITLQKLNFLYNNTDGNRVNFKIYKHMNAEDKGTVIRTGKLKDVYEAEPKDWCIRVSGTYEAPKIFYCEAYTIKCDGLDGDCYEYKRNEWFNN